MDILSKIEFFLLRIAFKLYLSLGKLVTIPVDNYVVLASII